MNRFRTRLIAAATAAALLAPLAASTPASAIPIAGNGCNSNSGITSSTIGWFPAVPASMSALKVACGFNNNIGSTQVSASFTIHDAAVAQYHNGAGRNVVTTAPNIAAGSLQIQLNPAASGGNGIAGLPVATAQPNGVNRLITGVPGIQPRTFVVAMTAGGLATINRPIVAPGIPGASTLKIENSQVRSVVDAVSVGVNTLTSGSANFTATDVGRSVSGTGIAPNTTITAINASNSVQISNNYEATCTAVCNPGTLNGPTVTIGGTELVSTTRSVTMANIDSATVIKSAGNTATWAASDVGLRVKGFCLNGAAATTNLPANVYITALGGGTAPATHNVTTTGGLTAGNTECQISIGEASANAPANGDVVAQQGVMLNLKPSLVAGSDDCINDQPEGFGVVGQWYNADNFQGSGFTNQQPGDPTGFVVVPATKAIGQIYIATSAATYSAFVVERRAATPGDPEPAIHYDIVFPFAPTGIAMCNSSATSPGLAFSISINSITSTVSQLPTGVGRPGAGQVRSIKPQASGGYITTASVTSDNIAVPFTPAGNFNRSCFYNTAPNPVTNPNVVNFQCGPG